MRLHKYLLTLLFFLASAFEMAGQNLAVKKFYHDERDFTANSGSTRILDQNEEPCALIKVRTMQRGFTFDVGRLFPILKTEEQGGSRPVDIYMRVKWG